MIEGHLLVVCTGNVCRSPYTEFRLRELLGPVGVTVSSAGTEALVGEPMADGSVRLLRDRGITGTEEFRARALDASMLASADLVLTAEAHHRSEVVRMSPATLRRTFTLRQLSRLLAAAPSGMTWPVDSFAELVRRAAVARSTSGPSSSEDDVADPWRRPASAYRAMAAQIEPVLTTLERCLALEQPPGEPT